MSSVSEVVYISVLPLKNSNTDTYNLNYAN